MSIDAARPARTITDPVVMYDSMWEAGNSLRGSLIWLKRHAVDPTEADRWWAACLEVTRTRERVSATDMDAQHEAMMRFRARERELEPLLDL